MQQGMDINKLVQGYYEYTDFSSEQLRDYKVPDYSYNILNKKQELYSPIVDVDRGLEPDWPGDSDFAVCLTHDMDHVSKFSWRQSWRKRMLRARMRYKSDSRKGYLSETGTIPAVKSVAGAALYSASNMFNRGVDPYHRYEEWLKLEDEYDANSTFFVLPEKTKTPHISDPEYRYDDRVVFNGKKYTVRGMIAEINEDGWEIGLHPSWYAYDDADELQRQKTALENIVSDEVESVRQHYLHYDPELTPSSHHDAGFRYDSTLGFNRNVGFRRGSSYPWKLKNIETGEELSVLEIPLVVQDTAIFRDKGLGLDMNNALEYIELLADEVADTGGVLTLAWHPSSVAVEERFNTYRNALEMLHEKGAWFGSVQEVGEYWMENNQK